MGARRPGVGVTRRPSDAARARAILRERPELARVLLFAAEPAAPAPIGSPALAAAAFRTLLAGRETEALAVIGLDLRGRSVGAEILTTGSDRYCIVEPRQIFRWALLHNAAAVLIAHNHPSGDPSPSVQDRDVTRRVASAGRAIGIRLADHLVLADPDRWSSLAEAGELPRWADDSPWVP